MKNSTRRGLRGIAAMAVLFIIALFTAFQTEQSLAGDIGVVLGLVTVIYLFCNAVLFYRDLEDEEDNDNGME